MSDEKVIYGRLTEAIHISGYTLERAMGEFKWLLEDGRWKKIGFADFDEFTKSLKFSDFKILADQRKEIVELMAREGASQRATARMLGVSKTTIVRDSGPNVPPEEKNDTEYEDVTEPSGPIGPPPEIPGWMDEGGDAKIKQSIRKDEKEKQVEAKKQEYKQKVEETKKSSTGINIFNTDKKFRIIYADPPWRYDLEQTSPNLGGAIKHYDSMSIDELCELPIKEITDKDAVLFLWVTSPKLNLFLQLMEAWGFEYKTSFVWDKVKHNMGHYNSIRHEFLLIGGKGKSAPDVKKLFDSVQVIERSDQHSEKPVEFMNIIDELYLYGERIELFCRDAKKEGWNYWGNEV